MASVSAEKTGMNRSCVSFSSSVKHLRQQTSGRKYKTRARLQGFKKKRYSIFGCSRWWGPSVSSGLASHFVRTTSARTPCSPFYTWCYVCCLTPEKSSYRTSTAPSPSLLLSLFNFLSFLSRSRKPWPFLSLSLPLPTVVN